MYDDPDYDDDVTVQGEYWIEADGGVYCADGDIGQDSHESLAIQHARHLVGEAAGVDYNEEADNWDEVLAAATGVDQSLLDVAQGRGDARQYAMQHWGWKRVIDDAVETWQLGPDDRRAIAAGMYDIAHDGDPVIAVHVCSTGESYELRASELEAQEIGRAHTTAVDIEAQNRGASNARLDLQYPPSQGGVHQYYRNRSFPLGDSLRRGGAVCEDTTYWVYACPRCDGDMATGDPGKGIRFRGSAKCLGCGHSCAVCGADNPMKDRLRRKDVPASELLGESLTRKIRDRTVTREDLQGLIETTIKSRQERIHRVTRPLDHNRANDERGHTRVGQPDPEARARPSVSGGPQNDPRRSARGRSALRRQAVKAEAKESSAQRVERIVLKHVQGEADVYGLWFHPETGRARVSLGDWAEDVDSGALEAELTDLLGPDKVELEYELGTPAESGWERLIPRPVSESAYPQAEFVAQRVYDPICPHCRQMMGEKHYVPDQESMSRRLERMRQLPEDELGKLAFGESQADLGPYLFRHCGPCYDKGPFEIRWPTGLGESVDFIRRHRGQPLTEDSLRQVRDPGKLKRLTARLLREPGADRDWLYGLYKELPGE